MAKENLSNTGQVAEIERLYRFLFGVVIVMGLALLGLIFAYIQFITTTSNNLVQQVTIENAKIDSLIQLQTIQLNDQKSK